MIVTVTSNPSLDRTLAVSASVPGEVPVRSTVGAGDSLLTGFLHHGATGPHALAVGIARAAAAVQTPGW